MVDDEIKEIKEALKIKEDPKLKRIRDMEYQNLQKSWKKNLANKLVGNLFRRKGTEKDKSRNVLNKTSIKFNINYYILGDYQTYLENASRRSSLKPPTGLHRSSSDSKI